ncbi:efflux RND transporter permease subunit [Klebsiella michiganensis]|uniref:efflux RND transporter permease subunit n=1 Tax=Klebsiella michiganensis TaxID=1134687 RepID=UPI000D65C730|nr:efflux RND transporter permease subunit [Klebsiella michiganensis]ELJ6255682.1 efflux RND transporter permease subunit [Klebsiella michiganensis]MDQ2145455.1 efflux RND transporter permease subunit [Klebsiella michiganensis]MDV6970871.1 efflux RND transporter permease subunit [Klebsiella michiganensis]MDW5480311.1 efflux RND transporter permease subunit [Klebsiella michiganensis]MDW5494359.1 efflux RND transporter permease subunit [Klebsiella michiganensis]
MKIAPSKRTFNLSAWALENPQMVSFFMLLIIVIGSLSYALLPRNEDPAFTIKTAVVSAQWPGASVTDTTHLVTDVLEKKLQETPWLDYIESETRAGQTVIYINLRDDTPAQKVPAIWYQIRKKMQDIAPSLPEGAQGPTVNDEFDDTYGTIYGFIPDGYSLEEVRQRVETIRRELMSVPDIGKTVLLGEQQEQIVIAFSPARLAGMGLSIQQVADALKAQNAVVPAGVLRTGQEKMTIKVSGALTTEESLRAVTLRINDRYLPLTDIATIERRAAEPPSAAFRVNGRPAIGLAISMAPTGNMLRFGATLNNRMSAIGAGLPHGIEMVKVADQSAVVSGAVSGFVRVLVEAVLIVLAVSFVSLGLRAGLVVAAAIPLVLAMTFAGMMLAGIGLQRISLGALIIALGLLVDDAMIAVETMVSRLEAGDTRRRAATYAFKTTAFPMLTGTLVMIAGFIPVGFASSSAGEYCFSLFAVVLMALLNSWVVAILFSPLTGTWLLPEKLKHRAAGPGRMARGYGRLLRTALRHRLATLGIALAALGLSVYGTTFMQGEFFPSSDRPELLVSLTLPANASQSATEKQTERLERALAGNRNIDHYSTYVGSGAIRFYLPMDVLLDNENTAQLVVVAKDLAARDRLREQLNTLLATQFSDLTSRVSPLELGPPVGWPIKYRVSGPDYLKVREYAGRLAEAIGRSPLTREVNQTAGEPERTLVLQVNQTAARAAGVSSQSLAQTLNTVWSGTTVTSIRDDDRLVDVVLRANDSERLNLATLSSLTVEGRDGQKIPLGTVATPVWGVDDPVLWRRQRLPFITVQTDLAPGMRAEGVSDGLRPTVDKLRASLPTGYSIVEGGVVAESEKGNSSVFDILPVTLGVMLLLLMLQLRRYSRMLLALLMAPFGLPGIVMAMLPSDTPMGFVALLGAIALAGVIIRNAVILISEVDNNLAQGMESEAAIIAAAEHRARPIFLTACAAILGMIPISHQVFWGPMAYAIIGGLIVATLVTLTVLPASFSMLLERGGYREKRPAA